MHGGISSIIKTYKSMRFLDRNKIILLPSVYNARSILKALGMIYGFFRTTLILVSNRNCLIHIHVASHKSLHRKLLYILLAHFCCHRILVQYHSGKLPEYLKNRHPTIQHIIISILNLAPVHAAVSRELCKLLKDHGVKGHISYLKNPPKHQENCYSSNREQNLKLVGKRYVLFAGRLEKDKGIWDLLEAWKLIHSSEKFDHFPNEIILVGAGPRRGTLHEEIGTQRIALPLGHFHRNDDRLAAGDEQVAGQRMDLHGPGPLDGCEGQ